MNGLAGSINIFDDEDIIKFLGREKDILLISSLKNEFARLQQEKLRLREQHQLALEKSFLSLHQSMSDPQAELTPVKIRSGRKTVKNLFSKDLSKLFGMSFHEGRKKHKSRGSSAHKNPGLDSIENKDKGRS